MQERLKHVSWTRKKQIQREFEENFLKMKAAKDADPKQLIKSQFHQGKLSQFAANDLIRLYEVMDESESISKLKIKNLQRIQIFNEALDLRKRDKALKKKDFENYERKKQDKRFSWQQTTAATKPTNSQSTLKDFLLNQKKDKALDNMIGFKERTSAQ